MSDGLSAGFAGIVYRTGRDWAGLGAMMYTVYIIYTRIYMYVYVPARNHPGNNELDVYK